MSSTVLFVDDEPNVTDALKRQLHREPYRILSARSAGEALEILRHESVDVIVTDEQMPGISGSDLLVMVRRNYPDTVRIILTGHARLDAAIRAINQGEIFRFFLKPCSPADLSASIRQALKHRALLVESRRLLRMVVRQRALLGHQERGERPGVESADPAATRELEDLEVDALTLRIQQELKNCETFFGLPQKS